MSGQMRRDDEDGFIPGFITVLNADECVRCECGFEKYQHDPDSTDGRHLLLALVQGPRWKIGIAGGIQSPGGCCRDFKARERWSLVKIDCRCPVFDGGVHVHVWEGNE